MVLQIGNSLDNLLERFRSWGNSFLTLLPNILIGILFLIFIFYISKYVRRLAYKFMRSSKRNEGITQLFASIASSIFIVAGIFVALSIAGWGQTITSLLAGAGIVGLILGLSLQDSLSSAIAGVIMTTRKSYRIGDLVKSNDYFGIITKITVRNTTVKQTNGIEVKIPNKLVLNNPLENFTQGAERRIDIAFGVGYKHNYTEVSQLIDEAIRETPACNKSRQIEVYFTDFTAYSVNILIRFWITQYTQTAFLKAQSDAIVALKDTFQKNNVVVTFPVPALTTDGKGTHYFTLDYHEGKGDKNQ